MLFRLDSCFTKLFGVQSFGGKLKLQLALFSFEVKDTITAVVKDSILPGGLSVTGDMEEDRLSAQWRGGALEVRNSGHWCVCV